MNQIEIEYAKWKGLVDNFQCEIKSLRKLISYKGFFRHYGITGFGTDEYANDFDRMKQDLSTMQPLIDRIQAAFIEAEKQRQFLLTLQGEKKT